MAQILARPKGVTAVATKIATGAAADLAPGDLQAQGLFNAVRGRFRITAYAVRGISTYPFRGLMGVRAGVA